MTVIDDHKWTEQVSNFARWERNVLSNEYEPHAEQIPIPVVSFVRVDNLSDETAPHAPETIEANFMTMLFSPTVIEASDTLMTVDVTGQQFAMYVCALSDSLELTTPVVAVVTDFKQDSKKEELGSQLHYLDDRKICFTTTGLWSTEKALTQIHFAGDGTDEKG